MLSVDDLWNAANQLPLILLIILCAAYNIGICKMQSEDAWFSPLMLTCPLLILPCTIVGNSGAMVHRFVRWHFSLRTTNQL